MVRAAIRNQNNEKIGEHYWLAGGHVYEFINGQGQKRSKVCFNEQTHEMAWEENGGLARYRQYEESGF